MTKSKKYLSAFSILMTVLAVCIYAYLIEPFWIEITHSPLNYNNGNPLKVVQLSDLHIQNIGRREEAILSALKDLHPDLIIMSGDVIDKENHLSILNEFLKGLPETNIVATLGNWEYWSNVNLHQLQLIYRQHKVYLLINESQSFDINERLVTVTGLDDLDGQPDLAARKKTPRNETTILVQHSPGYFDRFTTQTKSDDLPRYTLCLSGHTHGGQVTLFGKPLWTPPGSGSYVAGLYNTPVCPLYVSRGLGTSILPIRLGARPEIAVFSF